MVDGKYWGGVYNVSYMKKNGIQIDTRTFVRFWLVVIGFAVAALAIYSAMSALIIIGAAMFLALALNPPVNKLASMLPSKNKEKSRVLGTALAFVTVVAALGAFIFLVVPPVIEQSAKLASNIPAIVQGATEQYKGLGEFINHYGLQPQVDSMLDSIRESSSAIASNIGANLISSISSIFSLVSAIILTLVLAFFMLIEGPTWLGYLWRSYADKEKMRYHRSVLHRMYTVVTGYVTGQLTVSSIAGVVAGLTVLVLSLMFEVPANFVLPTMAIVFLLSLIPMFGAMISAVLISVILAFSDLSAALIFLAFFIIYQQVEANYISPKIQSKRIELTPLLILVSVTIGLYLFGIAGGIISIPIAGCLKILLEEYLAHRQGETAAKA